MKKRTKKKDIENAIPGAILLVAGFWIYWHFFHVKTPASVPPDEAKLLQIIESYKDNWNEAANNLAQMPIPNQRNKALCDTLSNKATHNWNGILRAVSPSSTTDENGKLIASIDITIAADVTVSTPPSIGAFADPRQVIEAGSPIFQTVSNIKIGTPVIFTGFFVPSDEACIEEYSLTTSSSMNSPDFGMVLTDLKPAP